MALSLINGGENLYVSGVFALRKAQTLHDHGVTHILSVIDYDLDKAEGLGGARFEHLSIDINDEEDADLLVHFPRIVRFIDAGLSPGSNSSPSQPDDPDKPPGGVLVHCAMGKSRSVTATLAYLLWKHPARFGGADRRNPDRDAAARAAVAAALEWVRATRPMAEPNGGFSRQLEMWWDMGTPARADDAVARHPTYRRWLYRREVEESARVGRAPDWIRFEDEVQPDEEEEEEDKDQNALASDPAGTGGTQVAKALEVRCKKCRRVLTTGRFIVAHAQRRPTGYAAQVACPHVFVEPLSWMRPVLEAGELEGRLVCPSAKCGASIGRYAWQGFKCSCDGWVCPAFSLQKSKVDEVAVASAAASLSSGVDKGAADPRAALGIRMPPSLRKENL
ncbi:hypothetical protein RB595_008717 [Gaeumannomyces hyphopodioides]